MAKTPIVSVAYAITKAITEIKNPEGKRNSDVLFRIHLAQELKRVADKMSKDAYAEAVLDGIIPNDDALRAMDIGTHIVAESSAFSATCKVSDPRKTTDVEAFAAALAKSKYKVPIAITLKLIEDTKKESARVLEKRVLEAV